MVGLVGVRDLERHSVVGVVERGADGGPGVPKPVVGEVEVLAEATVVAQQHLAEVGAALEDQLGEDAGVFEGVEGVEQDDVLLGDVQIGAGLVGELPSLALRDHRTATSANISLSGTLTMIFHSLS